MTIAEKVELILKHDPKSRDSDRRLLLIYVQKAGLNLIPEQVEVFNSLPAFETIRRTRQSLQEQGKYPASPKIEQERYEKFKQMRAGDYTKPEDVLEHTSPALKELVAGGELDDKASDVFTQPPPAPKYKPLPWRES